MLAVAVAVAVFCTSSARAYTNDVIGTVANYSTMTVALTVKTNFQTFSSGTIKTEIVQVKLVNKDLLNILASPDFANTTWPAGAKLVVGWDIQWSDKVLVVDSTGTNVLYNASYNANNNALNMYIYYETGVQSGQTTPATESYTWYNSGNLQLIDYNNNTKLTGPGPCTQSFTQKYDKSGTPTTWSDAESYSQSAASQFLLNRMAITSGTVKLSGHGNGAPFYLTYP